MLLIRLHWKNMGSLVCKSILIEILDKNYSLNYGISKRLIIRISKKLRKWSFDGKIFEKS